MAEYVHGNRNWWKTVNGRLGCYDFRTDERKKYDYPGEGGKHHRDVECHHDQELKNTASKNYSHQRNHMQPAVISFELQDEGGDANEGNRFCKGVIFLGVCETIGNRYQRTQPVACRPTRRSQRQRRYTLGTDREGVWAFVRLRGEVRGK